MATSIVRRMREALRWLFTLDEPQWADAEQVDDSLEQDIRFLRFQLTKTRSELTELSQRPDSFPQRFAALFHTPEEVLCRLPCRYEIGRSGGNWTVVLERCVFCGCAVKTEAFQSERDALLYTALLQTAGFRPRNNLSCSQCYSEYLKSSGLSVE